MVEAVAIIPARGGSVRVPRKNLREVGGRPLVQWTIEAAQRSRLTRVVVSTEDVEIATLARRLGVDVVPQPLDSAMSGTRSAPVVLSALDYLRDTEQYVPELVCLLHPTSPFRQARHIDLALDLYTRYRTASVISTTADTLNGALYLTSVERFRVARSFFVWPMCPLELPMPHGLDIDSWEDLERARDMVGIVA